MKHTLLLLACTCSLIVTSWGQASDARILVTVKDQFDSSIPDADILLTGSGAKEKGTSTNLLGAAQFSGLAAGEYRVVVSAAGFKDYRSENILVRNAETRKIEIVLEMAPIESRVDIGDGDISDPDKSGATTVLNENEIDAALADPQGLV